MTSSMVRLLLSVTVALGVLTLRAATALAGPAYAQVYFWNDTNDKVTLSGTVDGQWNGFAPESINDIGNADGSPPAMISKGQTAFLGSVSPSGGAFAGTGGKVTVDDGGDEAYFSWSVSWLFANGYGGGCDADVSSRQQPFGNSLTMTWAVGASNGGNTCFYIFQLTGGSGPPTGIATGPLTAGNSLSRGTAYNAVSSPDDKSHFDITGSGSLEFYNPSTGGYWNNDVWGGIVAIMQGDGNFVVYDSTNRAVWATNTYGNPGAFLVIGDTSISVQIADGEHCVGGLFPVCYTVNKILWQQNL
jgi:hypothetical protein